MKHSRKLWVLVAANLNCIDGPITPQAVDQWRQQASTALVQGDTKDRDLSSLIQRCFGTQIPACLQRLTDYVAREDVGDFSLDAAVSTSPQKQPPPELFLGSTGPVEYRVAPDVEARAAAQGWPSVRYKSRHSGGFDADTSSLLMIFVSGDKVNPPVNFDRWINIALPADGASEGLNPRPGADLPTADDYAAEGRKEVDLPQVFTMVSLDRRQGNTPGQIYFQRFVRDVPGNAAFKPKANEDPKDCVSCHPNGLRAISPLGYHVRKNETMMSDEDWQTVKALNDAMLKAAGTRTVSWRDAPVGDSSNVRKPLLNPAAFGPSVGPTKPFNGHSRTPEFIAQCAQKRREVEVRDIFDRAPGRNNVYRLSAHPQIDANKIIRSMNCGSCHGTAQRAPLNALTDWPQIDFKILVDQSMPLGVHRDPLDSSTGQVQDGLNDDERIALANCLQAEFKLELKETAAWLTQGECR